MYFTDAIIVFDVSVTVVDAAAAVSFVVAEELPLPQAAKVVAAKSINATIVCFMCVVFLNE